MAVPSISCSLRPPAPFKEASSVRPQPQQTPATTTTAQWSGLRRACVAAAACAVVGMAADGGATGMAAALPRDASSRAVVVAVEDARAGPPRWSDRRRCPAWRANSLENFVPENLPRPSAQRRFNGVTQAAPALSPDAGTVFLARRSGMGCFSM